jgi:hypothetical protein
MACSRAKFTFAFLSTHFATRPCASVLCAVRCSQWQYSVHCPLCEVASCTMSEWLWMQPNVASIRVEGFRLLCTSQRKHTACPWRFAFTKILCRILNVNTQAWACRKHQTVKKHSGRIHICKWCSYLQVLLPFWTSLFFFLIVRIRKIVWNFFKQQF